MAEKKTLPKGISIRKDGRYQARYTFNGKRHTIYGKTLKEVQKKLRDAQYEIDHTIRRELDAAFGLFHLAGTLNKIAALEHKLSVREWKKVVSKTLGIDLLEDYYSGDFYKDMIEKWVSDNVDLIKTVPHKSLEQMKEIVYSGYMNGQSTTNIIKEIQSISWMITWIIIIMKDTSGIWQNSHQMNTINSI